MRDEKKVSFGTRSRDDAADSLNTGWRIVETVADECAGWDRAMVVRGSLVSAPKHRRPDSDIDMLVIVESLPACVQHLPGLSVACKTEATDLLHKKAVDAVVSKFEREGTPVSLSAIGVDTLAKQAVLRPGEISYYRTTDNSGVVQLRSFDGEIAYQDMQATRHGAGYIVKEPSIAMRDDRPFIGVLPDALLAPVHVLRDDGVFHRIEDELWRSVLLLATRAIGSTDATAIFQGLMATKVKGDRLGRDAAEYIEMKLRSHA